MTLFPLAPSAAPRTARHPFQVRHGSSKTWSGITAEQAHDLVRRSGRLYGPERAGEVLRLDVGSVAVYLRRTPSAAEAEAERRQIALPLGR